MDTSWLVSARDDGGLCGLAGRFCEACWHAVKAGAWEPCEVDAVARGVPLGGVDYAESSQDVRRGREGARVSSPFPPPLLTTQNGRVRC